MSKNLGQIFASNPISSNINSDLFHVGRSATDAAITFENFAAQFTQNGVTQINCNSGNAIPSSGIISITGGLTGLSFSGSTNSITLNGIVNPSNGGTGINNGSNTLTLSGNLSTIGNFTTNFTMTSSTNVTFPTSGTLATTSQLPTPYALTKTDDTNVTLTLGGNPSTALLNATSLILGWNGVLSPNRGGTGVDNGSNTLTLGGDLSTSGNFRANFIFTNETDITFPTSGTLSTISQLPTPSSLTKVDDTNVTLTLGGTPSAALLQNVSITAGWSGLLSPARGGTGINNGTKTINLSGGSTGYVLTRDSDGNAYWEVNSGTGDVTIGTANQVLANGTSGVPQSGTVTLTTPQDIATTSNVTFNSAILNNRLAIGTSTVNYSAFLINKAISDSTTVALSLIQLSGTLAVSGGSNTDYAGNIISSADFSATQNGTIDVAANFISLEGNTNTSGTISNGYGVYVKKPNFGLIKTATWSENLSIGSSHERFAPPNNGAIIQGLSIFGNISLDSISVTPKVAISHNEAIQCYIFGTQTNTGSIINSQDQTALFSSPYLSPASGSTGVLSAICSYPKIQIPGGQTASFTASVYSSSYVDPAYTGTINNYAGYYYDGNGLGSTVTNAYSIYLKKPTAGTNKYGGYIEGFLGLGDVTAPSALLHLRNLSGSAQQYIERNVNTSEANIVLRTNGTNDFGIGLRNTTDSNFHIYNFGSGADALLIQKTTGNVGIGTSSPLGLLDVCNTSNTTGYSDIAYFRITNNSGGTNYSRLLFGQYTTNQLFIEVADQSNAKGLLHLQPFGGNVGVNLNGASMGSLSNALGIGNTTIVPNGVTGIIQIYAESGAAKVIGGSGTRTTFGPADPHCPNCGTDFVHEWENEKYEESYLAICMNCFTKGINSHTRTKGKWYTHSHNAA